MAKKPSFPEWVTNAGGICCPACLEPFSSYTKMVEDETAPLEFGLCAACGHIFVAHHPTGQTRNMTEAEKVALRSLPYAEAMKALQDQVVSSYWG